MSDRLPVYPYPRNDGRTHWEGCWAEQGHHNCAIAEVERLTAALVEIRDYPEGEDGRLDSMEAIAREALQEESDDE